MNPFRRGAPRTNTAAEPAWPPQNIAKMALLQVLKFPNPVLKRKSQRVAEFDEGLRALADSLLETMYTQGGIGLAAPQVGQLRRLIVVDCRDGQGETEAEKRNPAAFVNPVILQKSGHQVSEEGCLSVVEFTAEVARAEEILVEYQSVEGETRRGNFSGRKAVCLQHEIDHLDGKLFIDHLSPLKRQMVKKRLAKLARSA